MTGKTSMAFTAALSASLWRSLTDALVGQITGLRTSGYAISDLSVSFGVHKKSEQSLRRFICVLFIEAISSRRRGNHHYTKVEGSITGKD